MSPRRCTNARWQFVPIGLPAALLLAVFSNAANSEDFGKGERRELLSVETSELPQGKLHVGGGERAMRPGARSPWHSSGPKLLYVLEGTVTVDGLGGETYVTCGPAPKLCLTPNRSPWFFRNAGTSALRFVVIGIDSVDNPTTHEQVGTVSVIDGNRVTLVVGDVHGTNYLNPKKEMTIIVGVVDTITAGDDVMTIRWNHKTKSAERLVKLSQRWH